MIRTFVRETINEAAGAVTSRPPLTHNLTHQEGLMTKPTPNGTPPLRWAPVCRCETAGKIVRGMCAMHYDRWLHATPASDREPSPRSLTVDFWARVDKSRGQYACWEWTGPRNRKGYGVAAKSGSYTTNLAHRQSLAMETGEMPDPTVMACHRCDNPPCVNPLHLYWGSAADNARDLAVRQGIHNKGKFKLTCPLGHLKEGDNLRIVRGRPVCRICDNERVRLRQARLRASSPIADRVDEFISKTGKDLVLTVDAPSLAGVSRSTIDRAIKAGRLTIYRMSLKNVWVDADELRNLK